MYPFFFKIVHYYVNKTEIFVDMSYFLKIAVLAPILSTSACQRQHYKSELPTFSHAEQIQYEAKKRGGGEFKYIIYTVMRNKGSCSY